MLRSYLTSRKIAARRVCEKAKQQQEVLELRLEQELKQCRASMLGQIEALQQELAMAGGDNANLIREVEELRASLEAATKLAQEMEQQVQNVQTLHEEKSQQLLRDTQEQAKETAEMRTDYEALKQRLLESEMNAQEIVELRKRYETLKENHEDLRQTHQNWKDRMAANELRSQESIELRKRYETLKESNEELRHNHEQLKEKLIENENFLRTQEGKLAARFETQLAEARCENALMKADYDDLQAKLETCNRQLRNTQKQNAQLRAQFEETDEFDKENHNSSKSHFDKENHNSGNSLTAIINRKIIQWGHHK